MKKNLFLLIMFFLIPLNVFSKEIPNFSLNEVTAAPGSNVTVKLNLENNQEFGILTTKIHYDTEKLEYISYEIKGLKKAVLKGVESNNKGTIAFYAITLDKTNLFTDTGTLLVLEFEIKDKTEDDCEIKLEVTDYAKDENTPIKFYSSNGKIKVNKKTESTTVDENMSLNNKIEEKKEVIWESNNEEVATIDDKGNVDFKKDGNVTITAKEKENKNILYEKDYYVKDKINDTKNNNNNFILIGKIIGLIIIAVIIFIIIRKNYVKKK